MIAKGLSLIVCVALLGVGEAAAQEYPQKVVTIIVPFAAGGPTDTVARLVGVAMGKRSDTGHRGERRRRRRHDRGRPGREGRAGRLHAAAAPHRHATAMALYRKLPYDVVDDFEPIGLVTEVPMTLVAREGLPGEGPGGADRARQGEQGQDHVCQRRDRGGVAPLRDALHERDPDRPDDRALQGHGASHERPPRRPGRLHVRPDDEHDGPDQGRQDQGLRRDDARRGCRRCRTCRRCDEAGLPEFEVSIWHGLYAPKGTPKPVVDKLGGRCRKR